MIGLLDKVHERLRLNKPFSEFLIVSLVSVFLEVKDLLSCGLAAMLVDTAGTSFSAVSAVFLEEVFEIIY